MGSSEVHRGGQAVTQVWDIRYGSYGDGTSCWEVYCTLHEIVQVRQRRAQDAISWAETLNEIECGAKQRTQTADNPILDTPWETFIEEWVHRVDEKPGFFHGTWMRIPDTTRPLAGRDERLPNLLR